MVTQLKEAVRILYNCLPMFDNEWYMLDEPD
jgi:hypothetical protein